MSKKQSNPQPPHQSQRPPAPPAPPPLINKKESEPFPPIPFESTGIPLENRDLRDYFAAKAMQGIWSNPKFTDMPSSEIAQWAYNQADHMLKARKEG